MVEGVADRREDEVLGEMRHAATGDGLVRPPGAEGERQDGLTRHRQVEERDPVELVVVDLGDGADVDRRIGWRGRRGRGGGRLLHSLLVHLAT
jgi:hypothetical protein